MSSPRLTPFVVPVGIELTLVPIRNVPHLEAHTSHGDWGRLVEKYRTAARKADLPDTTHIHRDPGCVEYPSPILRSWEEAEDWYKKACAVGKSLGLAPYSQHHASGMGHIHSEAPPTLRKRAKLMQTMFFKPYLGWAFAHPSSTEYCKANLISAFGYKTPHYQPTDPELRSKKLYPYPSIKSYAVVDRRGYKTLEWRAFDGAADWETQEEHLALVQAMYRKVLSPSTPWPYSLPSERTSKDRDYPFNSIEHDWLRAKTLLDLCTDLLDSLDSMPDLFLKEIAELGLPVSRYEWYIERNLRPQLEWGYDVLTLKREIVPKLKKIVSGIEKPLTNSRFVL